MRVFCTQLGRTFVWPASQQECLSVAKMSFGAKTRILIQTLALMLGLSQAGTGASALEAEFAMRSVKRNVLALYDSRYEGDPSQSRIHRRVEMPLNWLGYKVTYVDVNGPLPPIEKLRDFRGVITWLIEPLNAPSAYLKWLDVVTASGVRYICFGDPSPMAPPADEGRLARIFGRLGLRLTSNFIGYTMKATITKLDPDMVGFERPVDKVLPVFPVVEVSGPLAQVHLAAAVQDGDTLVKSVLIASSPAGGYAADEYALYYDQRADKVRWIVNPFAFLKAALGSEIQPVPDVTTLDGRRIYFSHIDGDGWNNISEIEKYREARKTASEVVLSEIIEPYPDLPVSVGLIAGDALPELGGTLAARRIATRIYALPQVEVASHTCTHPFAWAFFARYSRKAELALIENAAKPKVAAMEYVRSGLMRIAGKSDGPVALNPFVAGTADLPRSYLKEPFDTAREVSRALEVLRSVAPPGKQPAIYLWSGDTEPFESIVAKTRAAGLRNMNGGDSRLDTEYPSVFYVPPIARPVGAERQIYAVNSNENTYTNNWQGPYWGQLALKETLDNTDAPRRLKAFNLYYHMFSGEKPGSLTALKTFVDLARKSAVIPITASHYAAIADDFFGAEISQVDATSWSVVNRGALQTLRFDAAGDFEVDPWKSKGVLGSRLHQGSLYVALDETVEPATVGLRSRPAAPAPAMDNAETTTREPASLIESRWHLSRLAGDACSFSFAGEGYGPGDMSWRVAPDRRYEVEVAAAAAGHPVARYEASSDASGALALHLGVDARQGANISVRCHAP